MTAVIVTSLFNTTTTLCRSFNSACALIPNLVAALLNDQARSMVQARRRAFEAGVTGGQGCDLLALFMGRTDDAGRPFSDKYLTDVALSAVSRRGSCPWRLWNQCSCMPHLVIH
jgi:hypothetical protein